jgi:hypothetical protein
MSGDHTPRARMSILVALVLAGVVAAQDECASAIPIGNGLTSGTNVGATNSVQTSSCNNMGSDVWYFYIASCNGFVEATFCQPGSASFDTVLAVFDGSTSCQTAVQLDCNDDTCLLRSKVVFPVSSGSPYYIAVGGFAGAQGTFSISLTCHQPPIEDDCIGAIPLGPGQNGPFSNQFATDGSPPASFCPAGFADLWFTFTPPCSGTYRIETCGGYDTVLTVLGGCQGPELACNDDAGGTCGPGSQVELAAAAATTYLVRVAGKTQARGSFNINVTQVFQLAFTSQPGGPASLGFLLDGGPAGAVYLTAITFNAGAFPNGSFFGVDLTYAEVLSEIQTGYPFFGVLDACGAFMFPPASAPFLSGQTIYAVGLATDATFTLPIMTTAPVSYLIP